MKDWEQYEQQIFEKFSSKYNNCSFIKNHSIKGIYSNVDRQIDVAIKGSIAGCEQFGIIECKCYNKKIDVHIIDGLIGFMQDVNASFGLIITTCGFSEAAKNRAKNQHIHLDTVELDNLESYEFEPDITLCHMCDDKYRNIVFWDRHNVENSFDIGHCAYCNETHIKCKNCGCITSVTESEKNGIIECQGECGLKLKYNCDELGDEYFELINKGKAVQ